MLQEGFPLMRKPFRLLWTFLILTILLSFGFFAIVCAGQPQSHTLVSGSTYSEKELLLHTATGNEFAFRQLMNTYQPLLLSFVYQLTRSQNTTEEIVQDVFLKIWMNRESLAHVHNFRSYLFIVCRNYALDQLRKIIREKKLLSEWEKDHAAPDTETPATGSEAEIIFTILDEAVAHLPPQQQKVYLLSRRQGLTHAQIARETGLSVLTVKKYMKLAIASIIDYSRSRYGNILGFWIGLAISSRNLF